MTTVMRNGLACNTTYSVRARALFNGNQEISFFATDINTGSCQCK